MSLSEQNRALIERLLDRCAISHQTADYLVDHWGQANLILDAARAEGVAALQHGDRARMEKALREAERELAFAVEHMGRTGGGYERALVSVRQALGSGKEF